MNSWLLLKINGWAGHSHLLDALMLFCARELVYLVFAACALWFVATLYRRRWQPAAWFLVNLVLALVLMEIAERLFPEARPFVTWHVTQLMPHAADQSFPSSHTTAASAIAFGFMVCTRWRKSGAIVLAIAVLIGFSRVFVGVHYPGDIVGGVVIAAIAGALVFSAKRWWRVQHAAPAIRDDAR